VRDDQDGAATAETPDEHTQIIRLAILIAFPAIALWRPSRM